MTSRKHTVRFLSSLIVCCLAIASRNASADSPRDLLIVANKAVSINALDRDEVRALFLKIQGQYQDGQPAVPIHAKEGSPARTRFQARVLGMTTPEEAVYWANQKIIRNIERLPEFVNPLKAVFSIRGAISYVLRSDFKSDVCKVLAIFSE